MTALCRDVRGGRWLPRRLPRIETRRLLLRAAGTADADAIAAALADYAVARMLARVPAPYFRQDALDWLGNHPGGIGSEGFAFAVTLEGTQIGTVGFDWRAGGPEIGYWLARRHWGRGLMSEAVSAALTWFFEETRDGAIRSGVLSDNPASLTLQRKLGFKISGLSETFVQARNATRPRIDTRLARADFRPVAGAAPAAYRHVV